MIYFVNKSVFNIKADAIVNTVNCDGFMGVGIALEFSLRFPELLKSYKEALNNNKLYIGNLQYHKEEELYIINFPTKKSFKNPSKLEWIIKGLENFKETVHNYDIKSVAFPLLGAGHGGLNKDLVKKTIYDILKDLNIDIFVCEDPGFAEGKEKIMLNNIKNTTYDVFNNSLNLNSKQIKSLTDNLPYINRFIEISKLDSIGKVTYEKLFKYFYDYEDVSIQLNLFD